jgi:hypothetical protein
MVRTYSSITPDGLLYRPHRQSALAAPNQMEAAPSTSFRSQPRQAQSWDRHLQQAPGTSEELLREVETAYMGEASPKEIAKQVDLDNQQLSRLLRARDVMFHNQFPTSGEIRHMRAMYEQEASLECTSERLGHTSKQVRDHLLSTNVATRDTHRR